MSRLVERRQAGMGFFSGGRTARQEYLERVAKYVPSEIIAAYLFLYGLFKGTGAEQCSTEDSMTLTLFGGTTAILWAMCPVYIHKIASPGEPRRLHMSMSALAFPIWVYVVGGVVDCFPDYYNGFAAAVLLVLFTVFSGALAPGSNSK